MSTLVYAPTITSGGGLTLLIDLIAEVKLKELDVKFFIHENLKEKVPSELIFELAKPGLLNRLKYEISLKRNCHNFKKLLMFCNLPPCFKLSCEVVTFVQNRLILQMHRSHYGHPKVLLRNKLLSFIFHLFLNNSDKWIVQTQAMKRLLLAKDLSENSIRVFRTIPLSLHSKLREKNDENRLRNYNRFLSITNSEPHKNNNNLVNAWTSLAEEGSFPELIIVTTKLDRNLEKLISQAVELNHANIKVFENIDHEHMSSFYQDSDCLIFTSGCESLGLPLLEARAANISILASDQDFVYEVCSPMSTFNPEEPLSIKDSVLSAIRGELKHEPYFSKEEQILPISQIVN